MAGDKREIILDLLARDKSGPATKSFAKNIEGAGNSATKAGKDVDRLNDEIGKTEGELLKLAHSFANAQTESDKLDISKSIRKSQNELRRLNTSKSLLKDILPDPGDSDSAIKTWAKGIQGKIGDALASIGPAGIGAGVLGVSLAPMIGASIAGAVVGAVGLGGVIGGIALAAKSPEIQAGAKSIGTKFKSSVETSAKDAFTKPIMQSLGVVEALAARSAPKIGKIFQNSAPYLKGLTDSLAAAGDAILDSLVNASGKAAPVMDALNSIISDTGDSLGKFIDMAADHSKEGADGLEQLNSALQHTITVASATVAGLADIEGAMTSLDGWIDRQRGKLEDASFTLDLTADGYKKGSTAAQLYRDGIIGVAGSANDYQHYLAGASATTDEFSVHIKGVTGALHDEQAALTDVSNAVKAQTDPVFGLLDASDQLATAQKNVADATKKHGKDSMETKAALRELATAAINLEGKAGALGSTFNGKLTPELIATLQAAGLTKGEIKRLGDQFNTAKGKGNAFAKNYKASLSVSNYKATWQSLYNIRDIANDIPRAVNIAVKITGNTNQSAVAAAIRKNVAARASGGPVSKGAPYWVGEEGPELIIPDSNAKVMSASASRRATGAAPRGGGMMASGAAGGSVLQLEVAGEPMVVEFMRSLIRRYNLLQTA